MDARLNCEWHGRMDMDGLSDAAWRVFTNALMWSNANGTDGWIPGRYQIRMHPSSDTGVVKAAEAELIAASLIEIGQDPNGVDGYRMPRWAETNGLGQSTAEEMVLYKANAANRSRRYREKQRQALAKAVGFPEEEPVTRDVTSDATRGVRAHVGKGKGEGRGKDQGGAAETKTADNPPPQQIVNQATGEVTDVIPGVPHREGAVTRFRPREAS